MMAGGGGEGRGRADEVVTSGGYGLAKRVPDAVIVVRLLVQVLGKVT